MDRSSTNECRIDESFATFPIINGSLPDLSRLLGLPDFDWAARQVMNDSAYTRYRTGSGGEWSYRNNLEVFERYRFRPRVMVDVSNIESSMEYVITYRAEGRVEDTNYWLGLLFLATNSLHPSLLAHAPQQASLIPRVRSVCSRRQRTKTSYTS